MVRKFYHFEGKLLKFMSTFLKFTLVCLGCAGVIMATISVLTFIDPKLLAKYVSNGLVSGEVALQLEYSLKKHQSDFDWGERQGKTQKIEESYNKIFPMRYDDPVKANREVSGQGGFIQRPHLPKKIQNKAVNKKLEALRAALMYIFQNAFNWFRVIGITLGFFMLCYAVCIKMTLQGRKWSLFAFGATNLCLYLFCMFILVHRFPPIRYADQPMTEKPVPFVENAIIGALKNLLKYSPPWSDPIGGRSIDNTKYTPFNTVMGTIEWLFNCCGVYNYTDYYSKKITFNVYKQPYLPDSCCFSFMTIFKDIPGSWPNTGCYQQGKPDYTKYRGWLNLGEVAYFGKLLRSEKGKTGMTSCKVDCVKQRQTTGCAKAVHRDWLKGPVWSWITAVIAIICMFVFCNCIVICSIFNSVRRKRLLIIRQKIAEMRKEGFKV